MKKTRLHILLPALVAAGLLSPAPAAFGNEPAIQRSCPELGNTYVTATITNANAYVPLWIHPSLRSWWNSHCNSTYCIYVNGQKQCFGQYFSGGNRLRVDFRRSFQRKVVHYRYLVHLLASHFKWQIR